MRFKPISEAEATKQASGLWEDGIYDYEVKEAEEKTSSAGNDMTELQVQVFDKNGESKILYDYLVNTEKAQFKIRQFAASCGLLDAYQTGTLMESEMIGRTGVCEVGTRPAKDGYPAKNVIRTWFPRQQEKAAAAHPNARTKSLADDLNDVVPF